MIYWACDLCGRKATERMVRGLIWLKGVHTSARDLTPERQKRYQRTRALYVAVPDLRFDICYSCVPQLTAHMFAKGQGRQRGRTRHCGVCDQPGKTTVRLYYGTIAWPRYHYAGHFCSRHAAPLIARARKEGAKGGDRLLREQGLRPNGSGKQGEIFVAGLT